MKEINHKESELIINPDGSIYHLHLRPEDIGDIILLVGDPDRVAMVSEQFDHIELRKQKREFITHTGRVGSKRVSVISTGIGTDNIDIVMNELDALANIDLNSGNFKKELKSLSIIRIGTSGALQSDIELDSLLVSAFGLGLDQLMHFYPYRYNRTEQKLSEQIQKQILAGPTPCYVTQGSTELVKLFSQYRQGITATCSGFYAPQGRSLRGGCTYPNFIEQLVNIQTEAGKITNFEMETAAIYGLANLLHHQAISVNAIIANRQLKTFSKHPEQAVHKAIQAVIGAIKSMN